MRLPRPLFFIDWAAFQEGGMRVISREAGWREEASGRNSGQLRQDGGGSYSECASVKRCLACINAAFLL
jgi:hypothetical protein